MAKGPSSSLLWMWTRCCPLIISLTSGWILRVTKPHLVNRQNLDASSTQKTVHKSSLERGFPVPRGSGWTWLFFSGDASFADYTNACIFGAKYYRNQHQWESRLQVSGVAWDNSEAKGVSHAWRVRDTWEVRWQHGVVERPSRFLALL